MKGQHEMGLIFDILNVLNSDDMDIVTEAEDITNEVKNETTNLSSDDSDGDKIDNSGDLSLNTDNLLADSTSESNDDQKLEESDNNWKDDFDGSDDDDSQNSLENQNSNEDNTTDDESFSSSRKTKLKKQFLCLFNVLDNNINLISTYVPNVTNDETIKTLTSIKENLTQCKEMIYDITTHDFKELEYHELLKKYVSLNRVYELSTKILETYFKKYNETKK